MIAASITPIRLSFIMQKKYMYLNAAAKDQAE
jgi:hypothetical protein